MRFFLVIILLVFCSRLCMRDSMKRKVLGKDVLFIYLFILVEAKTFYYVRRRVYGDGKKSNEVPTEINRKVDGQRRK